MFLVVVCLKKSFFFQVFKVLLASKKLVCVVGSEGSGRQMKAEGRKDSVFHFVLFFWGGRGVVV